MVPLRPRGGRPPQRPPPGSAPGRQGQGAGFGSTSDSGLGKWLPWRPPLGSNSSSAVSIIQRTSSRGHRCRCPPLSERRYCSGRHRCPVPPPPLSGPPPPLSGPAAAAVRSRYRRCPGRHRCPGRRRRCPVSLPLLSEPLSEPRRPTLGLLPG